VEDRDDPARGPRLGGPTPGRRAVVSLRYGSLGAAL